MEPRRCELRGSTTQRWPRLLVMMAMVSAEMSPGATVTVEVWTGRLHAPCWLAGMVAQPDMTMPAVGASAMTTWPAVICIAGEQYPGGTENGPNFQD